MTEPLTGGCLCGAVRYELAGEPINVRICHCRNCQRALSGPFFARALYHRADVTITGETAAYLITPILARVWCPKCGVRLFAERQETPGRIGVALASLDDPNALKPECHFFTASRLDWVILGDGLPQFPEWPPD